MKIWDIDYILDAIKYKRKYISLPQSFHNFSKNITPSNIYLKLVELNKYLDLLILNR